MEESHMRLADVRRVKAGGMPVAVLDRADTAALTIDLALERRGSGKPCLFFTTANGQVLSLCASDSQVRALYDEADLISADGMPIVIASRYVCPVALPERVATTDAFHDAARRAVERDASFFIFGATEEVNAIAVARAQSLYPGLRIAGRRNGYFRPEDEPAIVDEINAARPDVLWIGLGVPRQQGFIVRNRARLTSVGVAKTCGGLFDFLSGRAPRAPQWMRQAGLEWVFRLAHDPKRLFVRYSVTSPHALFLLMTRSGEIARP